MSMNKQIKRCGWAKEGTLLVDYHDHEWGVPIFNDRKLFEFLILEGMQAGLSWLTILNKRAAYRKNFDKFDPKKIIEYDKHKIATLMAESAIIRNRLKIEATIVNAKAYLKVKEEWGSFSDYIWHFVEGKPIQNHWRTSKQSPATTLISDAMSKDLKKKGFKFVGSTICYAFMQAVGMVNDHSIDCFRYVEVKKLR